MGTAESVKAFVKKLEGHATIKLSPSVLAELSSVSPETYTGVFAPGAELEAWAESGKIGARSKPLVIKAIADARKLTADM